MIENRSIWLKEILYLLVEKDFIGIFRIGIN